MDKINNSGKIVGAIIAIVIVILIVIAVQGHGGSSSTSSSGTTPAATGTTDASASTAVTTTVASTGASGSAGENGGSGAQVPATPPIIIRFITPVTNDQWTIGGTYPIAWDNAGNITGELDLVDATTGNFVGVILSQTGPNQTSYSWDAREYFLSRYSPLKKEVVAGSYKIRLSFDGNNLSPILSPAITISQ